MSEDCGRIVNLRHYIEKIEHKDYSRVKHVRWKIQNKLNRNQLCTKITYKQDKNQETNSYFACGDLLLRKNFSVKKLKLEKMDT